MVKQCADLDRLFQALADPSRRAIVERLCDRPLSVSELAEPFAMSLPAIMQHIAVLEAAGIVATEKIGRVRTCHVETDVMRAAEAWLAERRTYWERSFDRLETVLAEPEAPNPEKSTAKRRRKS